MAKINCPKLPQTTPNYPKLPQTTANSLVSTLQLTWQLLGWESRYGIGRLYIFPPLSRQYSACSYPASKKYTGLFPVVGLDEAHELCSRIAGKKPV
jgi:hypothetical protein